MTGSPHSPAGADLAAAKAAARRRVARHRDALVGLSHRIHAHPETAFEERRAAGWCVELLGAAGLSVREHPYDLSTAFEASAGEGPLTVAVCCEYDALPGIGHACGHNIIAAAGVGTGIALAGLAGELGLRVKVLGTPAEESGGGKALLLDRGAFAGVDAAMMVHPAPVESVRFRSFARTVLDVEYRGRAAHAAAGPFQGRNAADAMTVAQVALGLLRQQLPVTCRVHGVVTHGGDAYNVIPARTAGRFAVRATTTAELQAVRRRVEQCFVAGGTAAGCALTVTRAEPDYLDFRTDETLAGLYAANAASIGRARPIDTPPAASTDMANVSHVLPAIHPTVGVPAGGARPHQAEFAASCVTPAADRAVLDAATAMAWTAVDLAGRSNP